MPTSIFEERGRCLTSALALFFAGLILLAGLLFTPARPVRAYTVTPAAKADPCAAERADWKRVQGKLKIGRERPASWWTSQANLRQCEEAHVR